jgi:hypothetical protein
VYYDLLQYLYVRNLKAIFQERAESSATNTKAARPGRKKRNQQLTIQALFRAADQTANVMLRAIDYCPPVDLRYDEYARAVLRADEVIPARRCDQEELAEILELALEGSTAREGAAHRAPRSP